MADNDETTQAPEPGTDPSGGVGSPTDGLCPICEKGHDPSRCSGHKRPMRISDPIIQCRRERPEQQVVEGDWRCWIHERDTEEALARIVADRRVKAPEQEQVKRRAAKKLMSTQEMLDSLPPRPQVPKEYGALWDRDAKSIDNPVLTLAKVAGQLYSAFEAAGERVNDLTSLSVETRAGGEQLRGEVVLWEKLLGHLRATLVEMSRLNLDERLVRLEERRADQVAEALFWFTAALVKSLELDTARRALVDDLMRETVTRIVSMGEPIPAPTVHAISGGFL